jgi:hypothetical protein
MRGRLPLAPCRRQLLASMAIVAAVSACAGLPSSQNARVVKAQTRAAADPPRTPAPATPEVVEAGPAPDSWKRYFLDQNRFSAMFPASPAATEIGRNVAYEARNPAGALFMVVCGPSAEDHGQIRRARTSASSSGTIISDGYPYFFGTEGYLAHVRLPDKSERVMFFVEYGGRSCTVTAEVRSNDETSMHLIESFRPEPATR